MIFDEKDDKVKLQIGEAVIEESDEAKLLGTTVDTKLSFKSHVQSLYKKQESMP